MDPTAAAFLVHFGAAVGAHLTVDAAKTAYAKVVGRRPDLERKLQAPASPEEYQQALNDLGGELEALAGSGEISINMAVIEAVRMARFDHQDGKVHIGNSVVSAPVLITGGSGRGQTVISGGSELRSAGTGISVGQGASIVMTGNASIKQT